MSKRHTKEGKSHQIRYEYVFKKSVGEERTTVGISGGLNVYLIFSRAQTSATLKRRGREHYTSGPAYMECRAKTKKRTPPKIATVFSERRDARRRPPTTARPVHREWPMMPPRVTVRGYHRLIPLE